MLEPGQDISDFKPDQCLLALVFFNVVGDVSASVTEYEGLIEVLGW